MEVVFSLYGSSKVQKSSWIRGTTPDKRNVIKASMIVHDCEVLD